MDLIFLESREKIVKALEQVENIESITENPTCYINQHFDLNIKHISWRRIDLKAEIDQYCDQLLEENESKRTEYLRLSNETNQITKKINETKEELHLLKKQFDAFDLNITKLSCEFSQMNTDYLMEKLCLMHEEYKKSLLHHKDFVFIFYDRPIEDIVGKVIDEKKIVEKNLQSLLYEERILVHSEMISIEADIRESSSEGIQMVNEKSEPEHQAGQNFEKIKSANVEQVEENLSSISNEEQMPEHQIGQKRHTERNHDKVILSPNELIVERRNHSCGGIGKVDIPSEDNELEKVQEYEKKGGKFKINGHRYYFTREYKSKNKYFQCIKKKCSEKCPGSVTITPSRKIVNKVVHICNCKGTVDKPSEDNELEKVQEYEKIGGKFKINGHRYYSNAERKTGKKYFQCVYSNTIRKKCQGSISITPNQRIVRKTKHICNQIGQIIPQQSSKKTEKEVSPTLSVGWL